MSKGRKHIPTEIETGVLATCQRRCCLCWFWDSDDTRKDGQIAHLDHDPSNSSESNLVFLCFQHHHQYDSVSKQAKGITQGEVCRARDELLRHLAETGSAQRGKALHSPSSASAPALTDGPPPARHDPLARPPAGADGHAASTVFDQRGQRVGQQINVAGNANLTLNSAVPFPAAPKSQPPRPRPRPAAKKAVARPTPKQASAAIQPQPAKPAWSDAGLPDRLYVVFCRICGLDGLPADHLAAAQQALLKAVDAAQGEPRFDVVAVRSSVYGRFLCVRNPAPALQLAEYVLDKAARRGVRLAVGLTVGRLEEVDDLGGKNLIGPPINLAARLAAMPAAEEKIVLAPDVCQAACQHSRFPKNSFTGPHSGKVKRTEFNYYIRLHSPPKFGSLAASAKHRTFDAHTLIFDIARFSEKSHDEQWHVITTLHRVVLALLKSQSLLERARNQLLWYAPAGDGGVLVFDPDQNAADAAWFLAHELARQCQLHQPPIEIRLGIATGSVVVIENQLPVGTAILRADHLCGLPQTGGICVNQAFWSALSSGAQNGWRATAWKADAAVLMIEARPSNATSASTKEEQNLEASRAARQDAAELYRGIFRRLRGLLEANPSLGTELLRALESPQPEQRRMANVILDSVVALGLNETLRRLWLWLKDQQSRPDAVQLRAAVECLTGASVTNAQRLKETRDHVDGAIDVPQLMDVPSLEVLVAALLDQATRWKSPSSRGLPEGEGYISTPSPSDLAPPSDITHLRLRALIDNLLLMTGGAVQGDERAREEVLRQRLLGFQDLEQTFYSLFEQDDPLLEEVRKRGNWRLLLFRRHNRAPRDLLAEPARTSVLLKAVLAKLRELETPSHHQKPL